MDPIVAASIISGGSIIVSEILRSQRPKPVELDRSGLEKLISDSPNEASTLEKTKLLGEGIEGQPPVPKPKGNPAPLAEEGRATSIASGCIPCSLGHVGTCSGLIKEAVRYGRSEGVASPEVIDRVNMCLDELNTMERVDMRPEMITQLPEWERVMANDVLEVSRQTRHQLENVENFGRLEEIAADTETTRKELGRRWMTAKLANLSEEDKVSIQQRIMAKLNELKTAESENAG